MTHITVRPNFNSIATTIAGTATIKVNATRNAVKLVLDKLNAKEATNLGHAQLELALAWAHELVHYIQSVSTYFLYQYALNTLNGSLALLRNFTDFVKSPASFDVLPTCQNMLMNSGQGLSARDICEGMAVLESFRMVCPNGNLGGFLEMRDTFYPGGHDSPYRKSFDFLMYATDPYVAFNCLSALSYLTLQTNSPGATFDHFANILHDTQSKDLGGGKLLEVLNVDPCESLAWRLETLEDIHKHPVLFTCAKYLCDVFGKNNFYLFGGSPSIIYSDRIRMENRNLFFPPIVLYQYQHGDKIRGDFYNIAIDNSKFYWLAIDVAALQGAAERIVFGERDQDIYIACPFDKCPYFKTALCHRKYPPPNKSSGWEQCTFPKGFINMTNRLPDQAFEELRFLKRPPDLKLGKRLPENRAGMLAVEFEQYCRKLGSASLVLQSDSSIRCNQCGTYNIVTSYFVRGRMPSSIASLCGKCSREKRVDLDDMSKFSTFHAKEPHELI